MPTPKVRGGGWNQCGPGVRKVPKGHKGRAIGMHGELVDDPHWPYIFGAGTEVFSLFGMNSGVMCVPRANVQVALTSVSKPASLSRPRPSV